MIRFVFMKHSILSKKIIYINVFSLYLYLYVKETKISSYWLIFMKAGECLLHIDLILL